MVLSKTNVELAAARSAAANERRRQREPVVIDWDQAITNLKAMLNAHRGEAT